MQWQFGWLVVWWFGVIRWWQFGWLMAWWFGVIRWWQFGWLMAWWGGGKHGVAVEFQAYVFKGCG